MSKHTEYSSFREKLIEHLFLGELLKLSWRNENCSLEISKPEVDNSGYDVLLEEKDVIRHVQLKASLVGGKTANQKIHTKLQEKASGCVVWIYFDENTLELGPFLFFGSSPKNKLPCIENEKIAKHTKANKLGEKSERQNIRVIRKGLFKKLETIQEVHKELFG
jgi:hypothetical protein